MSRVFGQVSALAEFLDGCFQAERKAQVALIMN
jgi:hypothetical protein